MVMKHYPSGDHDRLLDTLGIPADARILDVGGGSRPFKYASTVVDWDFDFGNAHRDGTAAQHLPFCDQAFDFVICLHVLEHVTNPGQACEELMRVARKGFIETPRKWTDFYAGHPTHRWLVDEQEEKLYFEPIVTPESPFMNFVLPPLWDSQQLQDRITTQYIRIPCVQLAWDRTFDYQVAAALPEAVHGSEFMARRHYYYALNLLYWMGDFKTGAFHIRVARQLQPESEPIEQLYAFYGILTGGVRDIFRSRRQPRMILKALGCRCYRFVYKKILQRYRRRISFLSPDT